MAGQGAAELGLDDRLRVAGVTLLRALADAQDRPQARVGRPAELLADALVRLAEVAPPLRVADDDPAREADEHRGGDLAGVRAGRLVVDVLGADPDIGIRAREGVADRGQATRTAGR